MNTNTPDNYDYSPDWDLDMQYEDRWADNGDPTTDEYPGDWY